MHHEPVGDGFKGPKVGEPFALDGVTVRPIDAATFQVAAASSWQWANITEARAREALKLAHALVADLLDSDERFHAEVAGADLDYILVESEEADARIVCRLVGDKLVWSTPNGKPPAENQGT